MTTAPVRNPLGVHALVWAGNTSPGEVERAVERTAATGYDLLEFSLHDLDNLDIAHARGLVDAAGIQVACSRGLAFSADVSSDDTAVVANGADLLHGHSQPPPNWAARCSPVLSTAHSASTATPLIGRARQRRRRHPRPRASEASGEGITLGLEICNRYETNVINTARQALGLADDIGEDNVMIHLDTYHMNIEEDDLARPVLEVGDRLGYVHIGENHRGYLGSGHLDFTGFFHALGDIGFTGPITFESFSSAVVAAGLSYDLAVWRDLWDDGDDLAAHALAFISSHLAVCRPGHA